MTTSSIRLDREAARRAICIDFEGTAVDPPAVLGVACEGTWSASVVEPQLWPMAARGNRHGRVTADQAVDVLRSLRQRAIDEDRRILAWTMREIAAIRRLLPDDEILWWEQNLVNAMHIARRWKNRNRLRVTVEPVMDGRRVNRNALSSYMAAIGYEVPPMHGAGNTARRIRSVQRPLESHGSVDRLTSTQKAKWTNLLEHNRHDCLGMAAVVETATRDGAEA